MHVLTTATPVVFDPGGDEDSPAVPPPPSAWASFADALHLLHTTMGLQLLMDMGNDLLPSIATILQEAQSVLGSDIVYDDQLFAELNLPDFTADAYIPNDTKLQTQTLDAIIEDRLKPHRTKGLQDPALANFLRDVRGGKSAHELLCSGAKSFMMPHFKPNGGHECSVGGSYLKYRPLCNDALLQLVREGKALAFSKDALAEAGALDQLHLSPLVWAPKTGKVKGRTCLNLSKSSRNFVSVNDCVDTDASKVTYRKPYLPLLPDIAEMACQRRDALGHRELAGATVDVTSAYHQFSQSVATAKYQATLLRVPSPRGDGSWMQIVVIFLVGVFGFKIAGDIYCTLGDVVTQKHNVDEHVPRSVTYIDDGILIDDRRRIKESLATYIDLVRDVFGPDGVNMEKVSTWESKLVAIGWEFDFESWRVQPKTRGLAKLLHFLFVVIPPGHTTVHEKDLERLCGLLNWYAPGIPAGNAFVASLYRCKVRVGALSHRVRLSTPALKDIMWWRALAVLAWKCPHVLGADIEAVRRSPTATIFLRTDASSLVGGGGFLSDVRGGEPRKREREGIRWTVTELKVFVDLGVSINVLEYFVAMFYIMLWAEDFRGRCVLLECDNTAAVSWLMKKRATKGSPATDSLVKLFSLFCLHEKIVILSTHIRGVDNTIADFRSRDLEFAAQEADEGLLASAGTHGTTSDECSRLVLCRQVLLLCVTRPDEMHWATTLGKLISRA